MRIVIDMQGAQTESRFRGIGRYTMSFAQAVARNRGDHEIILALSGLFPETIEPIRAAFYGILPQENILVWHAPGPVKEIQGGNEARRAAAELIREGFLAALRPDIVHVSSLFEGYIDDAVTSIGGFDRSTRVSVTLYDLIPLLNPDHYLKPHPAYEKYYSRKVEALKRADIYLAISEFSKQEGVSCVGIGNDNVINIYGAIEDYFQPTSISAEDSKKTRNKFLLSHQFILYAGGADERKNIPRLIEAYAMLSASLRQNHQLVLAGKMSAGDVARFKQLAKSYGLESDELCFTGYVSDEELIQLYSLCELFVFPSWHEGFGLPVLEAMACGAPVIASNTSSLPEVVGLDEALFDPLDVSSISRKIAQALQDDAFRERLHEHAGKQARLFSWEKTAKLAIAAWESLSPSRHGIVSRTRGAAAGSKPRLAFVSPLPPERTGIADYSAELLPALSEHYDVEVVVDQDYVDGARVDARIPVRDEAWLRANAGKIDRIVYQVGNSPFHKHMLSLIREIPGTVVLHDFYLSSLMQWLEECAGLDGAWVQSLYDSHGYMAVAGRFLSPEETKRHYPANLEVLQHALGVIFHSEYSRGLVQKWYGPKFALQSDVIPLLRVPAGDFDKLLSRRRLGIRDDAFLVCSFGFLDPVKLNRRLFDSWLSSALASDRRCQLIFVGEGHGGDYGRNLKSAIESSGLGDRVRITGYVAADEFKHYLMAADLAVQLRTHSKGEVSAAVLDCMNYGVPAIVNANGSMAELDARSVWKLPDEFTDAELAQALETLWKSSESRQALSSRSRGLILENCSPKVCAKKYMHAIEKFHTFSSGSVAFLIRALGVELADSPRSNGELIGMAADIAASVALPTPGRTLFLDITATHAHDLKTGIERVVRALLSVLLESPPAGYRVEPVYLCQATGRWRHRYARAYVLKMLGCPGDAMADEIADIGAGDVLLGLDWAGDVLVRAERQGLFESYRQTGASIYFLVHDLLPVLMPDMFPPQAENGFADWLDSISRFDGAVCISRSVADDLSKWQSRAGKTWENRRPFRISWSHNGADLASSAPSKGMPDGAQRVLQQLRSRPSFLMVGTIEPRKGYMQAISAFGRLWNDGIDVNLVIVGKEGWKDLPPDMRRDIPETMESLRGNAELNKRLLWLEGISDEYLTDVYAECACLIAASYGEGFGLPLIEAAGFGLPIMARDIPVFREVAGTHAYYFRADSPEEMAQAIQEWLSLYQRDEAPLPAGMPYLTWQQSAENLIDIVTADDPIF